MKRIVFQKFKDGAVVKICAFENFYFNSGTEKFEKLLKPKFSDTDLTLVEKDTKLGIPNKKKKVSSAYTKSAVWFSLGGVTGSAMVSSITSWNYLDR